MNYKVTGRDNLFIKDSESESLILTKYNSNQLILNQSGTIMLRYILKEFPVNDIIKELSHIYPHVPSETLNKDLRKVMSLLNIYKIIELDSEVLLKKGVFIGDEESYDMISNFLKDNNEFLYPSNLKIIYFEPIQMRVRSVNYQEIYLYYSTEQKIKGVCSYIPPKDNSNVVVLTSLITDSKKDSYNILNEFEKKILEIYSNKKYLKIRLIRTSVKDEDTFKNYCEEIKLIKENDKSDVYFYTKILR